ncbi:MAG: phosphoglyceromutase [Bacteroidetes bacterium]|nr:phosphoglyceromutase [Bacteroidota bacterium]
MKKLVFIFCMTITALSYSQTSDSIENIIIITTDGLRWQEVFKGMDTLIASDNRYNQKQEKELFETYWAASAAERREKLLPFIWSVIEAQGQLYGNRDCKSNVNVTNKYWFSYPGYSEMFCGYADKKVNSNAYTFNPNTNLFEFMNTQKGFEGKVAAFGAWEVFDKILNEPRSKIPVVSGGDSCGMPEPDTVESAINKSKKETPNPEALGKEEYGDMFTYQASKHYVEKHKPRVIFIGYGETDVWAHWSQYASYLNAAHQFDQWMNDLWQYIQNDPVYKNKTLLFISTDHGRGYKENEWTNHNRRTKGSNQIWFGVMGPGVTAKGEVKNSKTLYQKQFAETWAEFLNLHFVCDHKVAKGFKPVLTDTSKKK